MFDQIADTERSILGVFLLAPGRFGEVSLVPDDFPDDHYRWVFVSMADAEKAGRPIDYLTITEDLDSKGLLERIPGGAAFVADLTRDAVTGIDLTYRTKRLREHAARRRVIHGAQYLIAQASQPGISLTELEQQLSAVKEGLSTDGAKAGGIRSMADIPDPFTFEVGAVPYVISEMILRGGLHMLTGEPGVGKSYFADRLGMCVARGEKFLGLQCEAMPVLFLDRENPLVLVQQRLAAMGAVSRPGVRYWGSWVDEQPPAPNDPRLLRIATQHKPLMIFDSFIRFHSGDENSASEMSVILGQLRRLAHAGATVIFLHHKGKAEGSKYRGSSDFSGSVDFGYALESLGGDLLQLHRFKSRGLPEATITLRADFSCGEFELADSPAAAERREEYGEMANIIAGHPGMNTREVIGKAMASGMTKAEVIRILAAGTGKDWRVEDGPNRARLYYPIFGCSRHNAALEHPEPQGSRNTYSSEKNRCSGVPEQFQNTGESRCSGVPDSLESEHRTLTERCS